MSVLELEVVDQGDHVQVVLSGEIDLGSAPELSRALDALRADGCREVSLQMAGVTFIDSSGLSALVRARNAGLDLVVVEPSDPVHQVITLGGLKHLLDRPLP